MTVYSKLLRGPEFKPHFQMQFSVIERSPFFGGSYPSARSTVSVL